MKTSLYLSTNLSVPFCTLTQETVGELFEVAGEKYRVVKEIINETSDGSRSFIVEKVQKHILFD